MRRLLRATPAVLFRPLAILPGPRAHAVLNARSEWMAAGLPVGIADQKARHYAKRLGAKRMDAMRKAQLNPMAKAAAQFERPMRDLILGSVARAQAAVPMGELERSLGATLGEVPWHVVEPVVQKLMDSLIDGGK